MANEEKNQNFHLKPGTFLGGHYQLIKHIGQGGMGSVYMVYDTRLDLKVAVKVILPELSENMDSDQFESILKRFETEAKIAAKIDHPNVIRIFGFNRECLETETGQFEVDYLIMELLSGRTLRNTMDISGFETDEEIKQWIEKYMLPLLDGMQKVHTSGIIHRDIKPENFFLKDDIPKLADFGLSLGIDLPSVTSSIADIYGTMHYMAPEQFYNFSLVGRTADIYSLGKILYEIVEGRLIDKKHTLKQVSINNTDTTFRAALNRVIMDATNENPSKRTSSAAELKNQLSKLLFSQIDSPSPESSSSLLRSVIAHKSVLMVLVVLATALGALWVHGIFDFQKISPAIEVSTAQKKPIAVHFLPHSDYPLQLSETDDHTIMHLIPPAEMELDDKELFDTEHIAIEPFYIGETPVTNQQYVDFLNSIVDRVIVHDDSVFLDQGKHLVLKLSEKIRGYRPIVFEKGHFSVMGPLHASCAVLMVTGFGAEAYVAYYGLRLPTAQEWFLVMQTGTPQSTIDEMAFPMPVLNYSEDRYGVRGINQIAEWGKNTNGDFVIMGQAPSRMLPSEPIQIKNAAKYYTDTGFRTAKSIP